MSSQLLNAARRVLVEHRASLDGRDASVAHLPSSATLELHRSLALSVKSSAKQIIAVSTEGLDPEAFEHVVWREASRAGLHCERVYMIPHSGFAHKSLKSQLEADRLGGIVSKCVIVSRLPTDVQAVHSEGMWILDDSAAVFAKEDSRLGNRGAFQWSVSVRESDIRQAQSTWSRIWELARPEHDDQSDLDLEEPLVLTADLLNGVAPVLCTGDHIDKQGCHWYHGTWQYLRLLQLVSTPTWHNDFYRRELLAALAESNAPKAIITGTADYSMLAYLAAAAKQSGNQVAIHIIDQCATPLFACRWYAKRAHVEIVAHEHDFLKAGALEPRAFDVVCTDAFLTRFSGSDVTAVLDMWSRILKHGGWLVTTVRVHQRALAARDPESAIKDFRERAVERAKRWEPFLRKPALEIGELAEIYARTMESKPIGDESEIRLLFENAGFEIVQSQLAEVPGELYPTIYLQMKCRNNFRLR